MFFVQSGTVEILCAFEGGELRLDCQEQGSYFGEVSCAGSGSGLGLGLGLARLPGAGLLLWRGGAASTLTLPKPLILPRSFTLIFTLTLTITRWRCCSRADRARPQSVR